MSDVMSDLVCDESNDSNEADDDDENDEGYDVSRLRHCVGSARNTAGRFVSDRRFNVDEDVVRRVTLLS